MSCFYCHKQGLAISDQGDCAECHLAVCADPPARPDKVFHSSRCVCGHCGLLVCKYDMLEHARYKGGTIDCFGGLAISASSEVLVKTSAALTDGRTASRLPFDTVDTFGEFLNFVTPGFAKLREAVDRSPDAMLGDLTELRTAGNGRPWLGFGPEFFTEGAMERVAALAAQTMRIAWSRSKRMGASRDLSKWLGDLSTALMRIPVQVAITSGRAQHLLRALVSTGELPSSLIRTLVYTEVPDRADDLADWVVGTAVNRHALS